MDNVKELTTLNDSDLVHVAGGSYEEGNSTDFCDACRGGAKKIYYDNQGVPKMSCRNCGKVYGTCPKCGAAFNTEEGLLALIGGAMFQCTNKHSFAATYDVN